jgi:ParB-like chromosome segregation protein Spo0J
VDSLGYAADSALASIAKSFERIALAQERTAAASEGLLKLQQDADAFGRDQAALGLKLAMENREIAAKRHADELEQSKKQTASLNKVGGAVSKVIDADGDAPWKGGD